MNLHPNADGVEPFKVQLYVSTDPYITTSDIPLLAGSTIVPGLAHGSKITVDFPSAARIPSNIALGNYYLGVIVDSEAAVVEQNELNNFAGVPVSVTNTTWTILAYLNGDNNLEARHHGDA